MSKFFKSIPLFLLLLGCSCHSTSSETDFLNRAWRPADAPRGVRLMFTSDGRLIGNAGVNTFFGQVKPQADGAVDMSRIGVTRMAGHPQKMAYEDQFLKKLNQTRFVRARHGKLRLLDAEEKLILELTPLDTPSQR